MERTIDKQTEAMTDKAGETLQQVKESAKSATESPKQAAKSSLEIFEKTPSPVFLGAAAASIVGSLVLFARGDKSNATFVGLWAPTFLALGMFVNLLGVAKEE